MLQQKGERSLWNTLSILKLTAKEASSVRIIDISPLEQLTGLKSFTKERKCATCTSSICPGKKLIEFGMTKLNELIDTYPCFIKAYLLNTFSVDEAKYLLENPLLLYIGTKTQAVSRTTTHRGSYGNLGTLLVILQDYIRNFKDYQQHQGMKFSDYLTQVRTLPGCAKIQNHAINHRLNEEFKKFFRDEEPPITRIPVPDATGATTYKLNITLLNSQHVKLDPRRFAGLLSNILQLYFQLREVGSREIIEYCSNLKNDPIANEEAIIQFFKTNLRHNDARMFEIIAFVILKAWYSNKRIIIGRSLAQLKEVSLELHRTGRVNANDGGIDYVLTPLGQYFQATQDFNFGKYFLDIDKLGKFPISFVIQTEMTSDQALVHIKRDAAVKYSNTQILDSYLKSFNEIFTLREFDKILDEFRSLPEQVKVKLLKAMLEEFVKQYSVEYNIEEL